LRRDGAAAPVQIGEHGRVEQRGRRKPPATIRGADR
jgi:hypothetical protein